MKWFQLDADMPHDPKIQSILEKFGNSGLGALIRLFCFVADHGKRPGWSIDSRGKPFEKATLVQAMGITHHEFTKIMSEGTQNGLFKKNAFSKAGLVVIPAMASRASNYEKRRVRTLAAHSPANRRQQDSTVQDKTKTRARARHGELRSPVSSGTTGSFCGHTPRCDSFRACTERTIAEARRQRAEK